MDLPVIKVVKREKVGSRASRKLRAEGRVPVNLFGLTRPTLALSIERHHADNIAEQGTHLVDLDMDGETQQALVTDVQWDPLGDDVLHLDFSRVQRDQMVTVNVEIEFEGMPKGVSEGGIVNHVMNEVEIECLPGNIPEKIVVDVTPIGVGENMTISDLTLPKGVKAIAEDEAVVVTVAFPQAQQPTAEESEEEGAEGAEGGEAAEKSDE